MADVADADGRRAGGRARHGRVRRIDLLVNNAGITGTQAAARCHETPIGEWDRVLGVNLRGPFLMTRAVLPVLLDQGRGHVINLVSIAGMVATRGRCAYTAFEGRQRSCSPIDRCHYYVVEGHSVDAVCPARCTPDDGLAARRPRVGLRATATIPIGRVARPRKSPGGDDARR